MTVETRDILLKAAEDVQSGMWCKGTWFTGAEGLWCDVETEHTYEVYESLSVDRMVSSMRCAEGSIFLATRLLGGTSEDFETAVSAVEKNIPHDPTYLYVFNDRLPDHPFEAGRQLAELFRTTAEVL